MGCAHGSFSPTKINENLYSHKTHSSSHFFKKQNFTDWIFFIDINIYIKFYEKRKKNVYITNYLYNNQIDQK